MLRSAAEPADLRPVARGRRELLLFGGIYVFYDAARWLFSYALFPVAPPRLDGIGIADVFAGLAVTGLAYAVGRLTSPVLRGR